MPRPRAIRFVETAIVLLGCAVFWVATRQPAGAAPEMSFCAAGWQVDVVAVGPTSSGPELCPPRPDVLERLRRTGRLGALIGTLRSARARGLDAPVPRLAAMPATMKALVVLLDFSDNLAGQTPGADPSRSHYQELLDSLGTYPTGSMRDYYLEQSYDTFDFRTDVLDGAGGAIASWYRAPETYAYYVDGQFGAGEYPRNQQGMAADAAALADPDVDYSQYDGDGDGYVDAFAVVFAGEGGEVTGDPDTMRTFKWQIPGSGYVSSDGVSVKHYVAVPEDCVVGVPCHEFAHVFGLPDLYDLDLDSVGVGSWSLMGNPWLGSPRGSRPPHLDVWSKTELGWVTPIQPTQDVLGASLPAIETDPVAYRLYTNGQDSTEYWLVENRRKVGFDEYLPGAGLLIWHVDMTVLDQWGRPDNRNEQHRAVDIEQADGLYQLNAVPPPTSWHRGDAGDPWPGSTNNRNFTNTSVPNSLTYAGDEAFVRVLNISDSADTMTTDLLVEAGSVTALPAPGYYMISFPLTPSSLTPHDLLCDDLGDGSYYMWGWQSGGYQTIPTSPPGCQTSTLSMEEGYWILALASTIGMRGTQPVTYQAIPLSTGWNMVAAPYEAAMDSLLVDNAGDVRSLADAQAANWVMAMFYYSHDGTGSYSTITIDQTPADTLSSWYGYWVLAGIDCSLIVPPPSGGAGGTAIRGAPAAQPRPAWAFDIQATSGSFADSLTIAASESASDGFDGFALDKPKPPSPPGEHRLRTMLTPDAPFVGRGCPSPPAFATSSPLTTSELAMETRSAASQPAHWHFAVTGGVKADPVVLSWPSLSLLPKDRVAILTDEDTGRRTFMRSRVQYEFAAPGGDATRHFTVSVKPTQAGALLISGLTATPSRSGAWDIGFDLSADAAVIARVYNVAGRRVADIANGNALPRGRASLIWSSRSITDTHVPSGVYLLRLTARTEEGEQASAVTVLQVGR